jgi:hypothetical protein
MNNVRYRDGAGEVGDLDRDNSKTADRFGGRPAGASIRVPHGNTRCGSFNYDLQLQSQPSSQLSQQLPSQLQSGQPSQQPAAQQLLSLPPLDGVAAGMPAKLAATSDEVTAREPNTFVNM